MKTKIVRYSIIGVIFMLLGSLVSASELKSDELNYTITVPDGWTVGFQNAVGFVVNSPDKKKTVALLIHKGVTKVDLASMRQFEQGTSQAEVQLVSSTNLRLDGVPAYKTVLTIGKAPFASSLVILRTVADGKYYDLQGVHNGGDVTHDSDIQEAVASFHFLQPPKLSISSKFGSLGLILAVGGVIVVGLLFWVVRKRAA